MTPVFSQILVTPMIEEREHAVLFPEDDRFLVERDEHIERFEVVHQTSPSAVG